MSLRQITQYQELPSNNSDFPWLHGKVSDISLLPQLICLQRRDEAEQIGQQLRSKCLSPETTGTGIFISHAGCCLWRAILQHDPPGHSPSLASCLGSTRCSPLLPLGQVPLVMRRAGLMQGFRIRMPACLSYKVQLSTMVIIFSPSPSALVLLLFPGSKPKALHYMSGVSESPQIFSYVILGKSEVNTSYLFIGPSQEREGKWRGRAGALPTYSLMPVGWVSY